MATRITRAIYTRPDGSRPAAGLRLVDRGLRAATPVRRIVRGVAARALGRRLPALLAHYDDRVFQMLPGDSMYASVFLDDEYEAVCCDLMRRWLRPGDCVVDIGANHGWFSLLMSAAVGTDGVVIACEPMPEMLQALRRNLELNPQLHVRLLPMALGAESGEGAVHLFAGLPHGHASVSDLGRCDYVTTPTKVERLDVALRDVHPQFIKLDVEGAELDVLRGADGLLAGPRPPSWLIEVNYETSAAMGFTPADLHAHLLAAHDYTLFRVVVGGLVRERTVAHAPQGSSWLFVSDHDRDRLQRVQTAPSRSRRTP